MATGAVVGTTDIQTLTNKRIDGAKNTFTGALVVSGEPWVYPALGNSWVNYGTPGSVVGYRKMADGTVTFDGLMKNGIVSTTVFTLPVGYRPNAQKSFSVAASGRGCAGCNHKCRCCRGQRLLCGRHQHLRLPLRSSLFSGQLIDL